MRSDPPSRSGIDFFFLSFHYDGDVVSILVLRTYRREEVRLRDSMRGTDKKPYKKGSGVPVSE